MARTRATTGGDRSDEQRRGERVGKEAWKPCGLTTAHAVSRHSDCSSGWGTAEQQASRGVVYEYVAYRDPWGTAG